MLRELAAPSSKNALAAKSLRQDLENPEVPKIAWWVPFDGFYEFIPFLRFVVTPKRVHALLLTNTPLRMPMICELENRLSLLLKKKSPRIAISCSPSDGRSCARLLGAEIPELCWSEAYSWVSKGSGNPNHGWMSTRGCLIADLSTCVPCLNGTLPKTVWGGHAPLAEMNFKISYLPTIQGVP